MTTQEFSDQFDLLYNNITSNQAPGLNEWEKSVFLTKAQEEILKNYFSPKGNPKQDGFDDTQKRQIDFSILMKSAELNPVTDANYVKFDFRNESHPYYFPSDLFLPINEQVLSGNIPYTVVPLSYSEYSRLMSKPYKYPLKYQAWRLMTNKTVTTGTETITVYESTVTSSCLVTSRSTGNNSITLTAVEGYTVSLDVFQDVSTQAPTVTVNNKNVSISIGVCPDIPLEDAEPIDLDRIIRLIPGISNYIVLDACVFPYEWLPATEHTAGTTYWDLTAGTATTKTITKTSDCPIVELIGRFVSTIKYLIRYVRRPKPIILVNLDGTNNLTINGFSTVTQCELPEELHEEILQRAIELAKVAWQGDTNTTVQSGQRSE